MNGEQKPAMPTPYLSPYAFEYAHDNVAASPLQALRESLGRLGLSDSTEPVLNHRRDINSQIPCPVNGNGNGNLFDSQRVNGFDHPNKKYESYGRNPNLIDSNPIGNLGGEISFTSGNPYLDQSCLSYASGYHAPRYVSNYGFGYDPYAMNGTGGGFGYDSYVRNNSSVLCRARDRVESQKLQDLIVEGSTETINEIFDDVMPDVCNLMVDPLGYLVFQKLLLKLTNDQITRVLNVVIHSSLHFAKICLDLHGTRAVQDLIRSLHDEEQIMQFMLALSRVALMLTRSNSANHVILLSFIHFTHAQSRCLLEVIVKNCYEIATDQHGCCMLQQCIGKSSGELREHLIRVVIFNALRLCVDCYGNYVVQYVSELHDRQVVVALTRQLDGHYVHLSRDKYASHVVQKCLANREFDSRRIIVEELMNDIDILLMDPFGNYVIFTVWTVSQDDVRQLLYFNIKKNAQLMRCNRYGRKLLEKLNSYMGRRIF